MDCPSGPFFYSRSVSGPRGQQLCLGCPGQGWGPAVQVAWAGFASTPAGERGSAPQELSTVFTVSFTLSSQVSWEDAGAQALCDGQSACVLGPSPLPAARAPSPPPADPRLPLGCPSMSLLGVFCRGSCLGAGGHVASECPCLQDTAPGQWCVRRGVVGQPTALPGLSGEKPCAASLLMAQGRALSAHVTPHGTGVLTCVHSGPGHLPSALPLVLRGPSWTPVCSHLVYSDWLVFSSFLLYIYSNKIMQQYRALPLGTAPWARGGMAEWVAVTPAPDSLQPCV